MLKLLRLSILVLLAPLVFGLAYEAYQFLRSGLQIQDLAWFLGGFGVYSLLYVAFLHFKIGFLKVLEHEIGHVLRFGGRRV